MSLAQKLLNKIQTEGRVSYGALCQLTMEEGYKIATMDRRLREHAAEGKICPVMARSKRNTEYISAYTAEKVETPRPIVIPDTSGSRTSIAINY